MVAWTPDPSFYPSPRMAMKAAPETLAYVAAFDPDRQVPDVLAVVDRSGRMRVFVQGDGAAPHNLELARRKAYTARTFGRTSLDWAQRTETQVPGQRQLTDVIPLQGGVPIKVGEDTIGGVGLSGAPNGGPQEEACGKAGVAKVADQLK